MMDLLSFIGGVLADAAVPYEYGEWTGKRGYPYFVGSFTETDHSFEDGHTAGTFTLDGWSRGSKLELFAAAEAVREAFDDLRGMEGDSAFYVRYGGCTEIPAGEEGLHKVTITLYTHEWKGTGE